MVMAVVPSDEVKEFWEVVDNGVNRDKAGMMIGGDSDGGKSHHTADRISPIWYHGVSGAVVGYDHEGAFPSACRSVVDGRVRKSRFGGGVRVYASSLRTMCSVTTTLVYRKKMWRRRRRLALLRIWTGYTPRFSSPRRHVRWYAL